MCTECLCLLLLKASQYFAEWAMEHVDILERRYVQCGCEGTELFVTVLHM